MSRVGSQVTPCGSGRHSRSQLQGLPSSRYSRRGGGNRPPCRGITLELIGTSWEMALDKLVTATSGVTSFQTEGFLGKTGISREG